MVVSSPVVALTRTSSRATRTSSLADRDDADSAFLEWCEQIPGWTETLRAFKLDLLVLFEVDSSEFFPPPFQRESPSSSMPSPPSAIAWGNEE